MKQELDQACAANAVVLAKLSNLEQQNKDNISLISGMTKMSKLNTTQQSWNNALQGLLVQMQQQCMSAEASGGQSTGFQKAGGSTGGKKQVLTWFRKWKMIVKYDPNKRRKSDGDPTKKKEIKY